MLEYTCLYFYLPVYQFTCLSVCLFVYLFIHVSTNDATKLLLSGVSGIILVLLLLILLFISKTHNNDRKDYRAFFFLLTWTYGEKKRAIFHSLLSTKHSTISFDLELTSSIISTFAIKNICLVNASLILCSFLQLYFQTFS